MLPPSSTESIRIEERGTRKDLRRDSLWISDACTAERRAQNGDFLYLSGDEIKLDEGEGGEDYNREDEDSEGSDTEGAWLSSGMERNGRVRYLPPVLSSSSPLTSSRKADEHGETAPLGRPPPPPPLSSFSSFTFYPSPSFYHPSPSLSSRRSRLFHLGRMTLDGNAGIRGASTTMMRMGRSGGDGRNSPCMLKGNSSSHRPHHSGGGNVTTLPLARRYSSLSIVELIIALPLSLAHASDGPHRAAFLRWHTATPLEWESHRVMEESQKGGGGRGGRTSQWIYRHNEEGRVKTLSSLPSSSLLGSASPPASPSSLLLPSSDFPRCSHDYRSHVLQQFFNICLSHRIAVRPRNYLRRTLHLLIHNTRDELARNSPTQCVAFDLLVQKMLFPTTYHKDEDEKGGEEGGGDGGGAVDVFPIFSTKRIIKGERRPSLLTEEKKDENSRSADAKHEEPEEEEDMDENLTVEETLLYIILRTSMVGNAGLPLTSSFSSSSSLLYSSLSATRRTTLSASSSLLPLVSLSSYPSSSPLPHYALSTLIEPVGVRSSSSSSQGRFWITPYTAALLAQSSSFQQALRWSNQVDPVVHATLVPYSFSNSNAFSPSALLSYTSHFSPPVASLSSSLTSLYSVFSSSSNNWRGNQRRGRRRGHFQLLGEDEDEIEEDEQSVGGRGDDEEEIMRKEEKRKSREWIHSLFWHPSMIYTGQSTSSSHINTVSSPPPPSASDPFPHANGGVPPPLLEYCAHVHGKDREAGRGESILPRRQGESPRRVEGVRPTLLPTPYSSACSSLAIPSFSWLKREQNYLAPTTNPTTSSTTAAAWTMAAAAAEGKADQFLFLRPSSCAGVGGVEKSLPPLFSHSGPEVLAALHVALHCAMVGMMDPFGVTEISRKEEDEEDEDGGEKESEEEKGESETASEYFWNPHTVMKKGKTTTRTTPTCVSSGSFYLEEKKNWGSISKKKSNQRRGERIGAKVNGLTEEGTSASRDVGPYIRVVRHTAWLCKREERWGEEVVKTVFLTRKKAERRWSNAKNHKNKRNDNRESECGIKEKEKGTRTGGTENKRQQNHKKGREKRKGKSRSGSTSRNEDLEMEDVEAEEEENGDEDGGRKTYFPQTSSTSPLITTSSSSFVTRESLRDLRRTEAAATSPVAVGTAPAMIPTTPSRGLRKSVMDASSASSVSPPPPLSSVSFHPSQPITQETPEELTDAEKEGRRTLMDTRPFLSSSGSALASASSPCNTSFPCSGVVSSGRPTSLRTSSSFSFLTPPPRTTIFSSGLLSLLQEACHYGTLMLRLQHMCDVAAMGAFHAALGSYGRAAVHAVQRVLSMLREHAVSRMLSKRPYPVALASTASASSPPNHLFTAWLALAPLRDCITVLADVFHIHTSSAWDVKECILSRLPSVLLLSTLYDRIVEYDVQECFCSFSSVYDANDNNGGGGVGEQSQEREKKRNNNNNKFCAFCGCLSSDPHDDGWGRSRRRNMIDKNRSSWHPFPSLSLQSISSLNVLRFIFREVFFPFQRTLTIWLTRGVLLDPFDEFFIIPVHPPSSASASSSSLSFHSSSSSPPAETENFLGEDSPKGAQGMGNKKTIKREEEEEGPPFTLDLSPSRLPVFISHEVAVRLLDAGLSLTLLQNITIHHAQGEGVVHGESRREGRGGKRCREAEDDCCGPLPPSSSADRSSFSSSFPSSEPSCDARMRVKSIVEDFVDSIVGRREVFTHFSLHKEKNPPPCRSDNGARKTKRREKERGRRSAMRDLSRAERRRRTGGERRMDSDTAHHNTSPFPLSPSPLLPCTHVHTNTCVCDTPIRMECYGSCGQLVLLPLPTTNLFSDVSTRVYACSGGGGGGGSDSFLSSSGCFSCGHENTSPGHHPLHNHDDGVLNARWPATVPYWRLYYEECDCLLAPLVGAEPSLPPPPPSPKKTGKRRHKHTKEGKWRRKSPVGMDGLPPRPCRSRELSPHGSNSSCLSLYCSPDASTCSYHSNDGNREEEEELLKPRRSISVSPSFTTFSSSTFSLTFSSSSSWSSSMSAEVEGVPDPFSSTVRAASSSIGSYITIEIASTSPSSERGGGAKGEEEEEVDKKEGGPPVVHASSNTSIPTVPVSSIGEEEEQSPPPAPQEEEVYKTAEAATKSLGTAGIVGGIMGAHPQYGASPFTTSLEEREAMLSPILEKEERERRVMEDLLSSSYGEYCEARVKCALAMRQREMAGRCCCFRCENKSKALIRVGRTAEGKANRNQWERRDSRVCGVNQCINEGRPPLRPCSTALFKTFSVCDTSSTRTMAVGKRNNRRSPSPISPSLVFPFSPSSSSSSSSSCSPFSFPSFSPHWEKDILQTRWEQEEQRRIIMDGPNPVPHEMQWEDEDVEEGEEEEEEGEKKRRKSNHPPPLPCGKDKHCRSPTSSSSTHHHYRPPPLLPSTNNPKNPFRSLFRPPLDLAGDHQCAQEGLIHLLPVYFHELGRLTSQYMAERAIGLLLLSSCGPLFYLVREVLDKWLLQCGPVASRVLEWCATYRSCIPIAARRDTSKASKTKGSEEGSGEHRADEGEQWGKRMRNRRNGSGEGRVGGRGILVDRRRMVEQLRLVWEEAWQAQQQQHLPPTSLSLEKEKEPKEVNNTTTTNNNAKRDGYRDDFRCRPHPVWRKGNASVCPSWLQVTLNPCPSSFPYQQHCDNDDDASSSSRFQYTDPLEFLQDLTLRWVDPSSSFSTPSTTTTTSSSAPFFSSACFWWLPRKSLADALSGVLRSLLWCKMVEQRFSFIWAESRVCTERDIRRRERERKTKEKPPTPSQHEEIPRTEEGTPKRDRNQRETRAVEGGKGGGNNSRNHKNTRPVRGGVEEGYLFCFGVRQVFSCVQEYLWEGIQCASRALRTLLLGTSLSSAHQRAPSSLSAAASRSPSCLLFPNGLFSSMKELTFVLHRFVLLCRFSAFLTPHFHLVLSVWCRLIEPALVVAERMQRGLYGVQDPAGEVRRRRSKKNERRMVKDNNSDNDDGDDEAHHEEEEVENEDENEEAPPMLIARYGHWWRRQCLEPIDKGNQAKTMTMKMVNSTTTATTATTNTTTTTAAGIMFTHGLKRHGVQQQEEAAEETHGEMEEIIQEIDILLERQQEDLKEVVLEQRGIFCHHLHAFILAIKQVVNAGEALEDATGENEERERKGGGSASRYGAGNTQQDHFHHHHHPPLPPCFFLRTDAQCYASLEQLVEKLEWLEKGWMRGRSH